MGLEVEIQYDDLDGAFDDVWDEIQQFIEILFDRISEVFNLSIPDEQRQNLIKTSGFEKTTDTIYEKITNSLPSQVEIEPPDRDWYD